MFKFFWVFSVKKNNLFNSFWMEKFLCLKNFNFSYQLLLRSFYFCCFFGKRKGKHFIKLFFDSLESIKPLFSMSSEYKKSLLVFIPMPLEISQQYLVSLQWLIALLFNSKILNLVSKFFFEVVGLVFDKKNKVFLKSNVLYFLALKNHSYKHFRWF